jgi:hypothetical protein
MKGKQIMKLDKFDVFFEYGQRDYAEWPRLEFINNEYYGRDKILHNVSAKEAYKFCKDNETELARKKEIENSHVKDFRAKCFWTNAWDD